MSRLRARKAGGELSGLVGPGRKEETEKKVDVFFGERATEEDGWECRTDCAERK